MIKILGVTSVFSKQITLNFITGTSERKNLSSTQSKILLTMCQSFTVKTSGNVPNRKWYLTHFVSQPYPPINSSYLFLNKYSNFSIFSEVVIFSFYPKHPSYFIREKVSNWYWLGAHTFSFQFSICQKLFPLVHCRKSIFTPSFSIRIFPRLDWVLRFIL